MFAESFAIKQSLLQPQQIQERRKEIMRKEEKEKKTFFSAKILVRKRDKPYQQQQ